MTKFINTVTAKTTHDAATAACAKFESFCKEHNLVCVSSVKEAYSFSSFGTRELVGYTVSFEVKNLEVVGMYNYKTHSFEAVDEQHALTPEEIDKINEMKTCSFCGTTRSRTKVAVVSIDNQIAILGLECYSNLIAKSYFPRKGAYTINDNLNEDYGFAVYATDLYQLLGFANEFCEPYVSSSVKEYFYAEYKSILPTTLFYYADYSANTVATDAEVEDLYKDIEILDDNNSFEYKIKRILQDVREASHNIHKAAVPLLLTYCILRKLNKEYATAKNFDKEVTSLDKIEATLIFAKLYFSEYCNTIRVKYTFKTADERLVVWYTSSERYADRIGKKFMISCKTASVVQDMQRDVLKAKRLTCKAA